MSAAAELRRVQDDALAVVPDPATEPVTVSQLDNEPTPLYDAALAAREARRGPIAALARITDIVA